VLSKQLQDLHTDVALLSETRPKPPERFFIPNYHFHRTDRFPGRKAFPIPCRPVLCVGYKRSLFARDKPVVSSQHVLHRDYDRKSSVKKISCRVLKGLEAKTN
jgi:hypothetical protein